MGPIRSPSRTGRKVKVEHHDDVVAVKKEDEADSLPLNFLIEKLKGDAPPYEVPASHAIDPENGIIFFNTYQDSERASEIYALNILKQRWNNITVREFDANAPIPS
jgi:hypothetical protein